MTGLTPNRSYPFPECSPPTVKDASDIAQLRDLALAIDTDVTGQEDRLVDLLEKPDAARISFSGSVATSGAGTGFAFIMPFDTVVFDNTAGSTALASNALRPRERGWYLVTTHIRCANGGDQQTMARHIRNSTSEGRRYEGPSGPLGTGEENMTCVDMLYVEAFDTIRAQVKQEGVGGTYTFTGSMSMVQMLKADV